ncbi:hypothetical protein PG991_005504 [Apiospora marii]|uniref:Myb-like domain-containing protein n=1 Tax=Apiospora marii TaxID=335849 RepID=A0ABR1S9D1_9PEZI
MAGADRVAEWQQSITEIRDPEDHSDDPPLIAPLYKACSAVFRDIISHLSSDSSVDKSVQLSLQRSQSYLVLWADGYGVSDGLLDKSLDKSRRARATTLRLLLSVSQTLTKRLFQLVPEEERLRLSSKITDVVLAADKIKFLIEHDDNGNSDSDGSSDTSSQAEADDLDEIAEDLVTDTQCLMDLGSRFQEEHVGPVNVEPAVSAAQLVTWDPSMNFVDRVRWRYPQCEVAVAERLGKANWARVLRHRETVSENTRPELVMLSTTNPVPAKPAPSQVASTTFHDSALGSSVPSVPLDVPGLDNATTEYAETMVSYRAGQGDSVRVPPLPDGAREGKPFGCVGCGMNVTMKAKSAWKKHLFLDLKPYICLEGGCTFDGLPFETKAQWKDHLSLEHGYFNSSMATSACPVCQEDISNSQTTVNVHLARHLEEIALTVLPTNLDSEDGTDLDSGLASSETSTGDRHESIGSEPDMPDNLRLSKPAIASKGNGKTNMPWTLTEEDRMGELVQLGADWTDMTEVFPTRTQDDIKDQWDWYMSLYESPEDEPKLGRTMEDIYSDELYSPNFGIASATPAAQEQSETLPSHYLFTQRLQAANRQHLSAPDESSSLSPFKEGSPLAPVFKDNVAQGRSAESPDPRNLRGHIEPKDELRSPSPKSGSPRRNKSSAPGYPKRYIEKMPTDDAASMQRPFGELLAHLTTPPGQHESYTATVMSPYSYARAQSPGEPPKTLIDPRLKFRDYPGLISGRVARPLLQEPPSNELHEWRSLVADEAASNRATTGDQVPDESDDVRAAVIPEPTERTTRKFTADEDGIRLTEVQQPRIQPLTIPGYSDLSNPHVGHQHEQLATNPKSSQLQQESSSEARAGPKELIDQNMQNVVFFPKNSNNDWPEISDLTERRRNSNRVAQLNYRKKLKRRLEDLEREKSLRDDAPDSQGKDHCSEEVPPANNAKHMANEMASAGLSEAIPTDTTTTPINPTVPETKQLSRPWKCPILTCKYHEHGWPTEKELNRHVKDKHSSEPAMYECLYQPCPYKSKRQSNCKQHMEKAHGWKHESSYKQPATTRSIRSSGGDDDTTIRVLRRRGR